MNSKTENIVNPVVVGLKTALTVSTGKNGKYALSKAEEDKGHYFEFEGLKVPFKALLTENSKTKGIVGICFISAQDCPSKALGLCQLPSDKLCYACSGECRATRRNNENGNQGMDSLWNAHLCSEFWDAFAEDGKLRVSFMDYLDDRGIETIRFNLKGDFRDERDILIIYHLAECGFKLTGYTARDDLAPVLEGIANHPNIILNGSNRGYTNHFDATDSLRDYWISGLRCLGSCDSCRKCYSLRNRRIVCLIHGKGSETALNNPKNREFVDFAFSQMGLEKMTDKEYTVAKGLITCINKALANRGASISFKSSKEFIFFVDSIIEGGKL